MDGTPRFLSLNNRPIVFLCCCKNFTAGVVAEIQTDKTAKWARSWPKMRDVFLAIVLNNETIVHPGIVHGRSATRTT